uniref:RRM domain-containing protein n=1 Tax=Micromonas pusilla TaxID=38833 RepID=A0A7S0NNC4_MICPS|mmetsp:Transcript_7506/g.30972  ORF Transcript_7506/g.30972 Transcript_7506/m.30972 type:complete len:135 (+) Transcript_7506:29-433(+)
MAQPKTTLYVGGLEEQVTTAILHAAFIPFGPIKDVDIPMDHQTQKHRGFGFVTFEETEDAAEAMDNMHNAELYGKVLRCNYAQPRAIKGGNQGWSMQPVWADADKYKEDVQEAKKEEGGGMAAAEKENEDVDWD